MRPLIIAGLLTLTATSWGAELLIDSVPTFDLPGFRTYTLSIETEGDEAFRGVDATFTGPINQLNPLGMATPFAGDLGGFHWFGDVSWDSAFLFNSGDLLSIGVTESDELLTGALAGVQRLNLPSPITRFAQIVTATPEQLHYDLEFDLGTGAQVVFRGFLIPEPTAAMLAALPIALLASRRRLAR